MINFLFTSKNLDYTFEWDDTKDAINFKKHGIHFKTAAKVFLDQNRLIREDYSHFSETRYDVLGRVNKILFVVFAIRKGNSIRIISARLATPAEKLLYENGKNNT